MMMYVSIYRHRVRVSIRANYRPSAFLWVTNPSEEGSLFSGTAFRTSLGHDVLYTFRSLGDRLTRHRGRRITSFDGGLEHRAKRPADRIRQPVRRHRDSGAN